MSSTESTTDIIVFSNHKFTANLYQKIINENQDFLFSPLSIQIALLLAYSGSSGKTAEEMKTGMYLPDDKTQYFENVAQLLVSLKETALTLSTDIFIEQNYKVKDNYKANIQKYFQSNFQKLDFKTVAEKTREIINLWIFKKTEEKISNVIPSGILDEYTRLVLLSAIHFNEHWLDPFKANGTVEEPFYSSENNFVNVKMMHVVEDFHYLEKEFYKILELPFEDAKFKMLIFLPHDVKDLSKLEIELKNFKFTDLFLKVSSIKVHVSFPNFKMEKFIDLKKTLMKIGIQTMFGDDADFSEMYHPSQEDLYIDDLLHKAVVEVKEKETEAAGATFQNMIALLRSDPNLYEFKVNRSFIFYIFYEDLIIFVGKKLTGD